MKDCSRRTARPLLALALLIGTALCSRSRAQSEPVLPVVKPEAVGFSTERLQRFDRHLQGLIDDGTFAGIVTLSARHGKIFHSKAYGWRDLATHSPMREDTIFRAFSMTKPIVGVAMMMLYEEGKWSPNEPIAKYIPEFAHLKVFKALGPGGTLILEDPDHAPLMRELMSHTAGFGYGKGNDPVNQLYYNEKEEDLVPSSSSPQEMINRLAKLPLVYQPGARFLYSVSSDIQGYLVEKLSGQPLAQFLQQRIFGPLHLTDTAFHVPAEKWNRFATLYTLSPKKTLAVSSGQMAKWIYHYDVEPVMPSGGAGLVSTAPDYLRFIQMLLNEGQLGGQRLLAPSTVRLMRTNQLPDAMVAAERKSSDASLPRGWGFGYDFAVFDHPAWVARPCGPGTYFWSGAAGTWFWIDPSTDVVSVGVVQLMGTPLKYQIGEVPQQMIYQALVAPER